MATRKAQHDFATHYAQVFASGDASAIDALASSWAKALTAAGYWMDTFASLHPKRHPLPPVADHAATQTYLNQISDPQVLGNALFSMWRQITHWEAGQLSDPDNRFWLHTACLRLAAITQPLGAIQQVTIDSSPGGFCQWLPMKLHDQQLTLLADGTAALINRFESGFSHRQQASVGAAITALLTKLATFADGQAGAIPALPVCDAGVWTLTVKAAGGTLTVHGPLIPAAATSVLCEQVRDVVPLPQLMLLDGQPDQLQRLVVTYQAAPDQQEQMVVDRRSQTLSLTQTQGQTRTRVAISAASVLGLLNDLPLPARPAGAASAPQTPTSAAADPQPDQAPPLTVTERFRYAAPLQLTGTLSLDDQVPNWPELAAVLRRWLLRLAPQMLDTRLIARRTPRKGDLLYAQVVFHHGEHPYSYLADPEYAVGDRVKVPTNYGTSYGTIVAMAYYQPASAPYPAGQTKAILALADPVAEAKGE